MERVGREIGRRGLEREKWRKGSRVRDDCEGRNGRRNRGIERGEKGGWIQGVKIKVSLG